ncbi:hypothetical protein NDU88_005386 [Pleurodeles waltl]|uniref:Uncharacterized protein n=1 Tax=Pleurodeles waltl TaxID=8319 RepID=A0AAV7UM09_PLEWA|nr:hypothetical protein NDU88_005386 [Pleurodeles waltl]
MSHACDGLDWADPHTAPTGSAAAYSELGVPSASSNHNLTELSQREPRCLKGPLILPGLLASGSVAEERKTADRDKTEGEDDGEFRAISSGPSSWVEVTAPSADYSRKENTKKPVVPSRDEGDSLREAGRECHRCFRRSVADAGFNPTTTQAKGRVARFEATAAATRK